MPTSCCDSLVEQGDVQTSSHEAKTRAPGTCPVCGQPGKQVQGQTVKALVSASLRVVQEGAYLFCRAPDCPVVYYPANEGMGMVFTIEHIRERVYQKEPDSADVLVCYCFRHTRGDITDGSAEQRNSIKDDILAGVQAGQCACDLRNPQGSCCLGNVQRLLAALQEAPRT